MPKKFSARELEIISIGLQLYKVQLKKMLQNSDNLKVARKEVKSSFLETEALIGKVQA